MTSVVHPPGSSRGTVVIDVEMCKGCELCIPACPPQVLVMGEGRNHKGLRFPLLIEGCTGCAACQLVCPDFCFEVWRYDRPPVPGDATVSGAA